MAKQCLGDVHVLARKPCLHITTKQTTFPGQSRDRKVGVSCVGKFYQVLCIQHSFLPHSPGVVYYHILLRRETHIRWLPPGLFK